MRMDFDGPSRDNSVVTGPTNSIVCVLGKFRLVEIIVFKYLVAKVFWFIKTCIMV